MVEMVDRPPLADLLEMLTSEAINQTNEVSDQPSTKRSDQIVYYYYSPSTFTLIKASFYEGFFISYS